MSSGGRDNSQYPYSPQYTNADTTPALRRLILRSTIWLWFARLAIACVALSAATIIALGVAAYRASIRASLVRDLEQRVGCSVSYAHEYPYDHDALPSSLRDRLGEHVWTEVWGVSHVDWSLNRDGLSADDVTSICNACRQFPRLKSFSMTSNHFSCDQIKDWPSLRTLEELSITSTMLSDSDLAVIAKMRRLKHLRLRSAKIGAEGLAKLAMLPQLETLTLASVEFIGSASAKGGGFNALKQLDIHDSPQLTDDAILALGPLPALENVVSNRAPLGDQSLEHLIGSGKVRLLIMNNSRVTNSGLKLLNKCPDPFALHLIGSEVTDEGLASLAGRQIESLCLDGCPITDEGLRHIAAIQGISYLSLADTKVIGTGISCLDRGESLPPIQLDGAPLTGEGVATLAKAKCTKLNLSRTSVGDEELMLFVASDVLGELNVSGTRVTANGIRAFYQARKVRLSAAGHEERLMLNSDFPEVVAEIRGIDPLTGEPIRQDVLEPLAN